MNKIEGLPSWNYNEPLNKLSAKIKNVDKRINFENWFIKILSSNHAAAKDLEWQRNVVYLLCKRIATQPTSVKTKEEDILLLRIFSKVERIAQTAVPSNVRPFYYESLYSSLKYALPMTTEMVLTKIFNTHNLSAIVFQAVMHNDLATLRKIKKESPEDFKAALLSQNKDGSTPLHLAVANDKTEISKFLIKAASETTGMRDNGGWTPLSWSVVMNNPDLCQFLMKIAPQTAEMQDKQGLTPLAWAVVKNNLNLCQLLLKSAPETALSQDKKGYNSLHLAIDYQRAEIAEAIAMHVPTTIVGQNAEGWTPVMMAVSDANFPFLRFLDTNASQEFIAALNIRSFDGFTPFYTAVQENNLEMIKFLLEKEPSAINIPTMRKVTPYAFVKASRPEDFKKTLQLFKERLSEKEIALEKIKTMRVALSHAWHIAGRSQIIDATTKEGVVYNLEGHYTPEWYHLMKKNLQSFQDSYPDLLTPTQWSLMKQLFELGANDAAYSPTDKLERIKLGLPTVVQSGFSGHSVTLLLWGNMFAICNRGAGAQKPFELFCFDKGSLDEKMLQEIQRVKMWGSFKEYKKLLFETLPGALKFSPGPFPSLQLIDFLIMQLAGNCTFMAPITANFVFLLLGEFFGIDQEGRLNPVAADTSDSHFQNAVLKALVSYWTWLSNLQLSFLEKNIDPSDASRLFEPDEQLIELVLTRAQALPLDKEAQGRLNGLTNLYLLTLTPQKKAQLITKLLYWKTLKKVALM